MVEKKTLNSVYVHTAKFVFRNLLTYADSNKSIVIINRTESSPQLITLKSLNAIILAYKPIKKLQIDIVVW